MSHEDDLEDALDRTLRGALQEDLPEPSAAHDQRVLEAARAHAALPVRRRRWPEALAAVVLLGIVALLVQRPERAAIDDVVRGDPAAVVQPPNAARLQALPEVFRWPAAAAGQSCRVVLRDAAARQLWTSDWTLDASVPLPEALRMQLAGTGAYNWTVECRGAGRNTRGPFLFELIR